MVQYYGYRPGGAARQIADGGNTSSNYLAYVPDEMTEDGWGYAMGVAIGPAVAGTLAVRLNIHDPDDNPVGVRQTTAQFAASAIVNSPGDTSGTKYTADFPNEVAMNNGSKYPLSVHSIGQNFSVGLIDPDAIPGRDNYLVYSRSDSSFPSVDPMGSTSSERLGHLAVWVIYDPNVPPNKPTVFTPTNGSTPFTLTPTFEANFVDANQVLPNGINADELETFQLDVRRVSDNHLMWSLDDDATGAERSAKKFTRVYDGEALVVNVAYKWRARVRDRFGAASAYTDYATFTPVAGVVSVSTGTPTGKQETQQPGPFTGVWTTSSGLSTNAVRVRIKTRTTGGIVRQLGTTGTGSVAKVVAPGGTISVTWAELVAAATAAGSTWANLPWGGDYVYEIQARDSANNWSGWSSPTRAFTVDAAPSVPTNLGPNYVVPPQTSRPLIFAMATDADDTVATGLIVKAGIVGPYAIPNPNFVTDASDWTSNVTTGVTANMSRTTVTFHDGVAGGRLQITANTGGVGAFAIAYSATMLPCVVGQSYTIRSWVQTDNAGIHPRLAIDWYTSGDVFIIRSTEGDWTPTTGNWYDHSFTATAPATAAKFAVRVMAYCATSNPLGSAYFDTIRIDDGTQYVRTMTWNATTKRFEYQTTSTDLPVFDQYAFWAYSFDGTVYSGGTTVEANAAKSASANFVYTLGPTVAITSPTVGEVLDTDTPTVAWTSTTTQAARRVVLRNATTLVELLDTGTVATATQTYDIPAGILEDDTSYDVWVEVTDTLAAVGNSGWSPFSLDYVEPPSVPGWLVSPTYAEGDVDPSAVAGSWDQPSITSGEFLHYRINREPAEDVPYTLEETEQESRRVRIGILHSVSTTEFVDYTAPSGIPLRYRIRVYVQKGSSWVSSQIETAQIQIQFDQSILQTFVGHISRPEHRVVMEYRGERKVQRTNDKELFHRMGKRAPLAFTGIEHAKVLTGKFRLHGNDIGDVEAQLRELDFMDGLEAPLLYRDGRGRYMFCVITAFSENDPAGGKIREVDLTLSQIDVPEIFE